MSVIRVVFWAWVLGGELCGGGGVGGGMVAGCFLGMGLRM